jgi:hypothetical protein
MTLTGKIKVPLDLPKANAGWSGKYWWSDIVFVNFDLNKTCRNRDFCIHTNDNGTDKYAVNRFNKITLKNVNESSVVRYEDLPENKFISLDKCGNFTCQA